MRVKDFMIREEVTMTADSTVDESTITLLEPRTGGVPVADDQNHLMDFVKDLDIGARQPVPRLIDARNIERGSTLQGDMRTGDGR